MNNQNWCICSETNPKEYFETPLHLLKFTVWCGVHANDFIGSYFFRNEEEAAVTVNGVRYWYMLKTFLFTKMQEFSRNGPVNWPPRSYDLTPSDYFLWGYVKSMVYADKLTILEALKVNIKGDINSEILEKLD